jgi:lipopolysaccharide export system protein LptA
MLSPRSLQLMTVALLCFFSAAAWAEEPVAIVWHPDEGKPMEVRADSMEVSNKRKIVTLRGNVLLAQGDVRLQCSKAVARYRSLVAGELRGLMRVECEPSWPSPNAG